MEVEDQIQLADVPEVPVQALYEVMDHFQAQQLVIIRIDGENEVEGGVPGEEERIDNSETVNFRFQSISDFLLESAIQSRRRLRNLPLVTELEFSPLEEVTEFWCPRQYLVSDVLDH